MKEKFTGLYSTVNESAFHDRFIAYGRKENFSYEGRKALFEYLEQLSEDMGEPIELDVIALCCDYSEYSSLKEFNAEYNTANPFDTWEEVAENTTVIEFGDGAAIVQAF